MHYLRPINLRRIKKLTSSTTRSAESDTATRPSATDSAAADGPAVRPRAPPGLRRARGRRLGGRPGGGAAPRLRPGAMGDRPHRLAAGMSNHFTSPRRPTCAGALYASVPFRLYTLLIHRILRYATARKR
ncbi:hypothetical protein EVAR_72607_1 [Eumeta japonica]|uniref:Uncharacterized protein n=1 Tax=Eumeta variegata TaxID=151549 RepID=A0A4C1TBP7_EUMVA|nr:hypothetical protein EVAR_72607_1 [Eumeta japonica]